MIDDNRDDYRKIRPYYTCIDHLPCNHREDQLTRSVNCLSRGAWYCTSSLADYNAAWRFTAMKQVN